jgi:hypothetical protein
MKFRALLLVAGLVVCLMPFAFGQGSASPAQPQDPTAQSPAANPPATPKTFPDSTSGSQSSSPAQPADQSGSQAGSPSSSQSTDQSGSQAGAPSTSSSSGSTATSTDNKNSFTGSIVKSGGKLMLRSGGTDYELDDQSQAKSFEGKDVKVNGQLDKSSNTIKVQSIEPASPMQ